jgi:hypothetical protein
MVMTQTVARHPQEVSLRRGPGASTWTTSGPARRIRSLSPDRQRDIRGADGACTGGTHESRPIGATPPRRISKGATPPRPVAQKGDYPAP